MPSEHQQQRRHARRRRDSSSSNQPETVREEEETADAGMPCRNNNDNAPSTSHWVDRRNNIRNCRWSLRRRPCGISYNLSSYSSRRTTYGADTADEIPGFYYDKVKKRYFRLVPGNNNFNPVTTETVRFREMSESNKSAAAKREMSLVHFTDRLRSGGVSDGWYRYKVAEDRLARLRNVLTQDFSVGDDEAERSGGGHDGCSFLLTHPEMSELVGFCFDDNMEAIKLMKWKLAMKRPSGGDEEDGLEQTTLQKSKSTWCFTGKVTDVCLAKTEQHVDCALFCSVGSWNSSSKAVMVALVDPLFHDPDDTEFHISFELGRSAVWSCAWSPNTQSVAFGLEGKSLVMDGFTMAQQHIHNKKQNTLAVCFSSTGRELYSGTNKSAIVCSDLRESADRHCTYSFPVQAPVTHMQLLPEHTLLISGHQNQLCTIDLRARKCLQTYPGHVNQHQKIHATVDFNEDVLCSAGQDSVVRIWSLSAGKLLKEVPPLKQIHSSDMAAAWFCSTPRMVAPSLVVAAKNEILVYQT